MADFPPRPGFTFPGPVPAEALEFFRARDLRVGFDYRDVSGAEHAMAFTVAKAVQLDILDDIRTALDGALATGTTYQTFRSQLEPILRQAGWWGVTEVVDPRTGDPRTAQLGSPRRLKTIFRANMRAARAAGQWARIRRTGNTHPYLLYQLGPSKEHRAEHAGWNGTLLRADDPWWNDHFPPNGWGCNCWVRQVSRVEAERLGGESAAPPRQPVEWTNPRTGEIMSVDTGLDPAWASNPGRDRERIVSGKLSGTLDAADQKLARASVQQVVDSPLLDRQLAKMKPDSLPKGDLPVAFLDPEWKGPLKGLGVRTQLVRLTQKTAQHQRVDHPEIGAKDYRTRLPEMLAGAQLVLRQTGHFGRPGPDLVFFHADGQKIFKAVIGREAESRVRLVTFYGSNRADMAAAESRGEIVRNRRRK